MSTEAYIAKQIGPDQYLSIFCKCNGYLEHLGAILAGHYDTEAKVDELLGIGDVYALLHLLKSWHSINAKLSCTTSSIIRSPTMGEFSPMTSESAPGSFLCPISLA